MAESVCGKGSSDPLACITIRVRLTASGGDLSLAVAQLYEFHKGSGECFDGHSNAAAFVSSAKVQICRCDRRNSDLHGGIVLGFNPHLESSA